MNPLGPGDPLRLGPYRCIGVLGAGGMGQVYLGRDSTGSMAAVKVLRPEIAHDPEMARRFVREAEAAQAVTSNGVAKVFGTQTEGGRPWIATEFLAGPTLDTAVDRFGPFPNAALRAVGAALAATLQDIHAVGLVHRDLKPSNIVLTSTGPRIIDFGIARPEHGLTLTSTGQAPVTPGYGAPEQVLGQRTGPAGDVFALGAVLVYAASGHCAYEGGHVAAVQYEVVHGEARLEQVPPDLRPLIAPCLAKEAAQRPLPEHIAKALAPPRRADRAWREGPLADDIAQREDQARRLAAFPMDDDPGRQPGRRRAMVLLAGGTLAAAGLGTGGWWLWGREEGVEGPEGPESWAAELLPEPDGGSPPRPLWGPLEATAVGESAAPLPVRDVVVVAAAGGGLRAYDVRDGKRRWERPDLESGAQFLAPTSELVLGADEKGSLIGVNAEVGKREWSSKVGVGALLAADEGSVYFATQEGDLRAVELESRKTLWTVPSPVSSSAETPAVAAVGERRLVLSGTDGRVVALDTRTGKVVWDSESSQGKTALVPAIAGGSVYLGGRSLTALSLADGSEHWSHPSQSLDDGNSDGWTAPAVLGKVLYAADGAELKRCKLSDGSQSWTYPLSGGVPPLDPPVIQGHSLWISLDRAGGAGVVTIRAGQGTDVWLQGAGQTGERTMAAAGNRLFMLHRGSLSALPVF